MELVRDVGAPGVVPGEERVETLTDRICHLLFAICASNGATTLGNGEHCSTYGNFAPELLTKTNLHWQALPW
jgi:hypothetical protein